MVPVPVPITRSRERTRHQTEVLPQSLSSSSSVKPSKTLMAVFTEEHSRRTRQRNKSWSCRCYSNSIVSPCSPIVALLGPRQESFLFSCRSHFLRDSFLSITKSREGQDVARLVCQEVGAVAGQGAGGESGTANRIRRGHSPPRNHHQG